MRRMDKQLIGKKHQVGRWRQPGEQIPRTFDILDANTGKLPSGKAHPYQVGYKMYDMARKRAFAKPEFSGRVDTRTSKYNKLWRGRAERGK